MPSKIKAPGNKLQAQSAKSIKEIERQRRAAEAARKAIQREKDKELKATLKKIKGMGIYEPKSFSMTPYRRKRIKSIERQYSEYLSGEDFFFIPVPKAKKNRVIDRANSLGIPTTRTGLIVPKDKHTKAVLKENPKGEFYILRTGKTKQGINQGRKYSTISPLAGLDELEKQKERLRRQAKSLGALKTGERLNFVIVEGGYEGRGTRFFSGPNAIEELFAHIDSYQKDQLANDGRLIKKGKSVGALVHFYRHVKIIKSTIYQFNKDYPPRSAGKAGRQRVKKGDYRSKKGR